MMTDEPYNPDNDPNAAPSLESELATRERQMSKSWEPDYCALSREAYPASAVDRSVPCGCES